MFNDWLCGNRERKMKKFILFLFALAISIMLFCVSKVSANEIYHVKSTAYSYNSGQTATQTIPCEGRTLAGKPEWFGKTVIAWVDKGNGIEPQNYLGTFICEDTGGEPIKKGYVVDIFIKDHDRAIQYGMKKLIILVINAEG